MPEQGDLEELIKKKKEELEVLERARTEITPPMEFKQKKEGLLRRIIPTKEVPNQPIPSADSDPIVGNTFNFEDYLTFQYTEATAGDIESLVQTERAIAKGERGRLGTSKIMIYTAAIVIIIIVVMIAVMILPDVLKGFGIGR